jgi:hypothetical protein
LRRLFVKILRTSSTGGDAASPISEYDLKIDAQVEKFLENKHKLTYFLVTASAAPIAVVVQFAYGKSLSSIAFVMAVAGVVTGLAAAASALQALQFELASYRNHIEYRYARKTWDGLTALQQESWDRVNIRAAAFTRIAFLLLCVEFALFAVVGIFLLLAKPDKPAHHFNLEISSKIGEKHAPFRRGHDKRLDRG